LFKRFTKCQVAGVGCSGSGAGVVPFRKERISSRLGVSGRYEEVAGRTLAGETAKDNDSHHQESREEAAVNGPPWLLPLRLHGDRSPIFSNGVSSPELLYRR
jgi:hypothetical protein